MEINTKIYFQLPGLVKEMYGNQRMGNMVSWENKCWYEMERERSVQAANNDCFYLPE